MGRFERGLDRVDAQRARNQAAIDAVTAPQHFVAEECVLPTGQTGLRIVAPLDLDELLTMDGLR